MTLLSPGEDINPKTLNNFMIEKEKTEKYASFKFNSLKTL
jgi:hypothetical protein